jgi:hypothetical protein
MMRRWLDRVQDGCVETVRAELAGLQSTVEQSLNTNAEALRRELEAQRAALETMRRGDRDERALFAGALDRLVGVLDSLASALELERRERLVQTELVECLLRETLIHRAPAASPAQLVGGAIDPARIGAGETTIDLREVERAVDSVEPGVESIERGVDSIERGEREGTGPVAQLRAGAPVQVRSQFHDRWTDGFTIAQVRVEEGRRRFQLKRSSDGTTLPVWFDATDVRAVDRVTPASVAAQMSPVIAPAGGQAGPPPSGDSRLG